MALFQAIVSEVQEEPPAQMGDALSLVMYMAAYFIGTVLCILAIAALVRCIKKRSRMGELTIPGSGEAEVSRQKEKESIVSEHTESRG